MLVKPSTSNVYSLRLLLAATTVACCYFGLTSLTKSLGTSQLKHDLNVIAVPTNPGDFTFPSDDFITDIASPFPFCIAYSRHTTLPPRRTRGLGTPSYTIQTNAVTARRHLAIWVGVTAFHVYWHVVRITNR